MSGKKKMQMPGIARIGIGLLILGALLVGLGQYWERGAVSLYGLVDCGKEKGTHLSTDFYSQYCFFIISKWSKLKSRKTRLS